MVNFSSGKSSYAEFSTEIRRLFTGTLWFRQLLCDFWLYRDTYRIVRIIDGLLNDEIVKADKNYPGREKYTTKDLQIL